MAGAFPALMMAGAAISAAGAIQRSNAEKAAANYNAQLRERDATIATQQATQQAWQVQMQQRRAAGAIQAGYGASGVTGEGSPLDVLAMSASQAKLDEETILYQGKLKATGYMSDAALARNQAIVAGQQGQLEAASYLVGGAGQAAYAGARAGAGRDALTTANPPEAGSSAINWYANPWARRANYVEP